MAWKSFAVSLLSPFFMTFIFIHGVRAYGSGLYLTVWNILSIPGSPTFPLVTILFFVFPLLGLALAKKIPSKQLAVVSTISLPILALTLGLDFPYEVKIFLSALIVGFYGIFFPFYLAYRFEKSSTERSKIDLILFTCGLALALSLDLMIQTLVVTYDAGTNPLLLPVQLVLALTGVALGVLMHQERLQHETVSVEATLASRKGGVLIPSGVGALFFLEFVILTNPNIILRWTQPKHTFIDLVILISTLILVISLSVLALAIPRFRSMFEQWKSIFLGGLILFVSIASLLFVGTLLSVALLLVAQFFITFLLYALLRYVFLHRFRWTKKSILSYSFFTGLLLLLLGNFMYVFSFSYAFLGFTGAIFEGQRSIILLSTAAILFLASTLAVKLTPKTRGEKRRKGFNASPRFLALLTILLIPLVISSIWGGYVLSRRPSTEAWANAEDNDLQHS